MAERVHCELCGGLVQPHAHYVVRIDVFADPTLPAMSTEQLEEMNFGETFDKLLEQLKQLTPDEAQDQVFRRFEYRLCGPCQKRFLANPLGKPRDSKLGEN
jgi:hypothetical protein